MNQQLGGTFDIKMTPLTEGNVSGVSHGRMAIDKVFQGDMRGTSKGEMLALRTAGDVSGGYVALERVEATVQGKHGTFVLQHSGIMHHGATQLSLTVVPDSGTEGFVGISGSMTLDNVQGQHKYTFDCVLP